MAEEPIKPLAQPVKQLEDAKNEVFDIWRDMRGRLVGFQVVGSVDLVAAELTTAIVAHLTGHPMYIVQQQSKLDPVAGLKQPNWGETPGKAEGAKAKAKEEKASA